MNKVYVKWDPLHERVVCVHTNEEDSCPACDKVREEIKDTGYFLNGNWFVVDGFEQTDKGYKILIKNE